MRLQLLKLENFQGISAAEFSFDGKSASLYGENATGKTTVFNAVTWLLFDKASTGAKNFTPKSKTDAGDAHFLDHTAEATFQLDNGQRLCLRKTYHENYKKKRGSATEEFDGHSVDYYIDGVPVKEKQYQETLLAACGGAEQMKILTMPDYFPEELPWEARRRILLDMTGDISDADIITLTEELADLPRYLLKPGTTDQHYTVDEYKKIAATKKSDINKQLTAIPGRIDEATRAIPGTAGVFASKIDEQIQTLTRKRASLEEEKLQAKNGDLAAAALQTEIANIKAQIAEGRAEHLTAITSSNESALKAVQTQRQKITESRNTLADMDSNLRTQTRYLEQVKTLRQTLLDEYTALQNQTWDESQAVCPTCNRELPEENVTQMRETFNLTKSQKLQSINTRGQQEANQKMIEEELKDIENVQASMAACEKQILALEAELAELQKAIINPVPFEATDTYMALSVQLAARSAQESDQEKRISGIIEHLDSKIKDLDRELDAQQTLKANLAAAARQKERITELKATEKELAAQYEDLERGIYLCEKFIRAKVSRLNDQINSRFKRVRFRLFQEQLNGGLREDCEVMIPSEDGQRLVPFAFANNAARINAGLEIIDTLSRHWRLSMPVFVDNAESVTRITDVDTQVIRLVVSEPDKSLRLELSA